MAKFPLVSYCQGCRSQQARRGDRARSPGTHLSDDSDAFVWCPFAGHAGEVARRVRGLRASKQQRSVPEHLSHCLPLL
jgi:hypothetical protein